MKNDLVRAPFPDDRPSSRNGQRQDRTSDEPEELRLQDCERFELIRPRRHAELGVADLTTSYGLAADRGIVRRSRRTQRLCDSADGVPVGPK